jgi:Protein of unknown function (DUF3800)
MRNYWRSLNKEFMTHIYLDESGDLSFDFTKKGTSKFFIITVLISENKVALDRLIKKINLEVVRMSKGKSIPNMLHASKQSDKIRIKLLTELISKDVQIDYICIDKRQSLKYLSYDKHRLYLDLTISLIDNVLKNSHLQSTIQLIASKRETDKNLNEKFINGIESFFDNKVSVEIQIPQNEKGLQVVDFCSWGIFRKYEYGDDSFYEIFEEKLLEIEKD